MENDLATAASSSLLVGDVMPPSFDMDDEMLINTLLDGDDLFSADSSSVTRNNNYNNSEAPSSPSHPAAFENENNNIQQDYHFHSNNSVNLPAEAPDGYDDDDADDADVLLQALSQQQQQQELFDQFDDQNDIITNNNGDYQQEEKEEQSNGLVVANHHSLHDVEHATTAAATLAPQVAAAAAEEEELPSSLPSLGDGDHRVLQGRDIIPTLPGSLHFICGCQGKWYIVDNEQFLHIVRKYFSHRIQDNDFWAKMHRREKVIFPVIDEIPAILKAACEVDSFWSNEDDNGTSHRQPAHDVRIWVREVVTDGDSSTNGKITLENWQGLLFRDITNDTKRLKEKLSQPLGTELKKIYTGSTSSKVKATRPSVAAAGRNPAVAQAIGVQQGDDDQVMLMNVDQSPTVLPTSYTHTPAVSMTSAGPPVATAGTGVGVKRRNVGGDLYVQEIVASSPLLSSSPRATVTEAPLGSDEWRQEALAKIRSFTSLQEFAEAVESGFVKPALHALGIAQHGLGLGNDLEEWAKKWAIDLRNDVETPEYIEANKLDAYRKVSLELLFKLRNLCHDSTTAADFANPTSVFKPIFTQNILYRCLPMDRAKCLYWNIEMEFSPHRGCHWYSEHNAKHEGWTDINPSSCHTINKRYQWILEMLLERRNDRFDAWLQPARTLLIE